MDQVSGASSQVSGKPQALLTDDWNPYMHQQTIGTHKIHFAL